MNPIRRAGVIAFLSWIQKTHPEIYSLRALSKDHFMALAAAFEMQNGLEIDENHDVYRKWESTQYVFSSSPSDQEAVDRL